MNKRLMILVLISIIILFNISVVSAAEEIDSDVVSTDIDEEIILEETQAENNLNNQIENEILDETPNEGSLGESGSKVSLDETPNEESLGESGSKVSLDETPNEEILTAKDELTPLSDNEIKFFTDLYNLIHAGGDEITLENDYMIHLSEYFSDGILIDRPIKINGNGHTINALKRARIFHVTSSNVILENIIFLNGVSGSEGGAIYGDCTAINCKFTGNSATYGGAMAYGTAIDCNFTGNSATYGGAMAYGTAKTSFLTDNNADYGGALYQGNAISCLLERNKAKYEGGAIKFGNAIGSSSFNNNEVEEGTNTNIDSGFSFRSIFFNNENVNTTLFDAIYFDVENFTTTFGSGETINIKLIGNVTGGGIANAPGLPVIVTVFNGTETVKEFKIASCDDYDDNLPVGNYSATLELWGYNISSSAFNITINKGNPKFDVENITIVYPPEGTLNATLHNEGETPMQNVKLTVNLDGNITEYTTDDDGKIHIPLNGLTVGPHTASISFEGNESYEGASIDATITVNKIPLEIECEDQYEVEYNDSSIIIVTLKNKETQAPVNGFRLSVDINGTVTNYTTDNDGKIQIVTNTFSGGDYEVKIGSVETDYYTEVNRTISILVNKQVTQLSGENVTTIFNSDDKMTITLKNEEGNPIANAEITLDLIEDVFVTDSEGKAEVSLKQWSAGNYIATITYAGNENYTESSATARIIINKESTTLSANNVTRKFDKEGTLVIVLKDGQGRPIPNTVITVFLDGFEEKTTDENGTVKISTDDLEINQYGVFVLFNENENYTASNTTAMINITKEDPPIIYVDDYIVNWGENVSINITLLDSDNESVSGVVKLALAENFVVVSPEYFATANETGEAIVQFAAEFDPNTYNLQITYLGNDYYKEGTIYQGKTLTIKGSSKLDLDVNVNQVSFGENTTLSIKAMDSRGQEISISKVNVTVGDKEAQEYDIEEGVVNLGKLSAGSTNITVSYEGSGYDLVTCNLTVFVNPATPDLTVIPGEANVTIEVKDGESPLSGTAQIFIDGAENPFINQTIDETGKITVSLDKLSPEQHAVEVVFSNENYTIVSKTVAVKVVKFDSVLNVTGSTVKLGEESIIAIQVTDVNNNSIGGTVDIFIDGASEASISKDIDETGKITVSIGKLSQGNHAVEVVFSSGKYADSHKVAMANVTYTPPVVKKTATALSISPTAIFTYNKAIDKKKNYYFYVTLKDANGKVLSNKKVKYTTNGKVYTGVTNSKGQIRFVLAKSKKGQYTVAVSFLGDDNYLASFKSISVKVKPQKVKLITSKRTFKAKKKVKKLTAILKNSKGKAIRGKKIVFIVKGKKYTAKTNKKGIATVKVKLSKKKTYKVKIKFAGDNTYRKASKKTSVKIK